MRRLILSLILLEILLVWVDASLITTSAPRTRFKWPKPWRRLFFNSRRSKFPIIPPRRLTTTTSAPDTTTPEVPSTTTAEILEEEMAPSLVLNSTQLPLSSTTDNFAIFNHLDMIEVSSSDVRAAVVWPVRRRPAVRSRFRSTSPPPRLLSKLLEPRPTRPAIYSLDGFVPKPSLRSISTTEAPAHIVRQYATAASSKKERKQKSRQSLSEGDDDEEEYKRRKFTSRYRVVARKGLPGRDFPTFSAIPATNFDCQAKTGPGVYADPETGCQVWHMCPGGSAQPRHSFLCPNGTIFNDNKGVCDWWYNVYCKDPHNRD